MSTPTRRLAILVSPGEILLVPEALVGRGASNWHSADRRSSPFLSADHPLSYAVATV